MPDTAAGSTLERIPTLPVFFKLRGQPVLVAGGEAPAAWKTELLAAAGALVHIVAETPSPELEATASALGPASAQLIRRAWCETDLRGKSLAIGAFADDRDAARFRDAARGAGVPVNVIDKPDYCDFQFGTLIVRSPLVVAITTDGAAPVFGQTLRARIETLLPPGLRAWAEAAQAWRPLVREKAWPFGKRRRFWELMADRALQPDAPLPTAAERQACFDAVDGAPERTPTRVTLVGCGRGGADDLTFAAARILQNADLIIHDADVAPETIHFARREARKLLVSTDEAGLDAALSEPGHDRRLVWLGTGNPLQCPHWRMRLALLSRHFAEVEALAGLDHCPRCGGRCTLIAYEAAPPEIAIARSR